MFIEASDARDLIQACKSLEPSKDESLLIFIGEKNYPNINELVEKLNEADINFIGGIFPGIIHGNTKYDSGSVIIKIPVQNKTIVVEKLNTNSFTIPELKGLLQEEKESTTALVLVDGLTSNIALFLARLFDSLGNSVNYLGGGGGSLSLDQMPCLFSPEGFFQDAALITFIPMKSQLGVKHGWEKVAGPIVATKTMGNIVSELNWENAFDVYRKIVEEDSGKKFTASNFFDIAKGYPFGIFKEGNEDIVRDPLALDKNGNLVCVGEVPENTVLNILRGKNEHLINAAGEAAEICTKNLSGRIKYSFVFDCISRVLFLENDFQSELAVIESKLMTNAPIIGALTLGEISSYGTGYLEFFNKTTVVGVLNE